MEKYDILDKARKMTDSKCQESQYDYYNAGPGRTI